MANQQLIQYINDTDDLIKQYGLNKDYIQDLVNAANVAFTEEDEELGLSALQKAREYCEKLIEQQADMTVFELDEFCKANNASFDELELWWNILKTQAQHRIFDSYLLYVEKKRELKDKFYQPKRKCLLKIGWIQTMQDLIDDKLDLLTLSGPPGCAKTTCLKFFHSAVCGWFDVDYNLFFSHSAGITRMYYDGVLDIMTNSDEYAWNEIFPEAVITSTNAKQEQININSYKPFPNVQTASVGSSMAGKVRANKFLFIDDMISKIEEALNKNTLDKLWNIYSTDARQRKVTGCKEIIIATRWSVHDPIGRLQRIYENNDRCRFISTPDIDPVTGKSNFDYDINGFTVEFYHDQELLMDEITYRCLYKNDPIEREGLLYHDDELRRYVDMPEREPDAILSVCDTKSKGTDFLVMPVLYQYDNDYYLVDTICTDSSDYGVQYGRMANMICEHNIQQCEFESNAGGDRVAFEVDKLVKEQGGRCNITTKPTETNKETRIITNADWVKKNVLFKDKDCYSAKSDYGIFMSWLLSYSVAGKNVHDDVPDCMANFALFVTNKYRVRQATIIPSPF